MLNRIKLMNKWYFSQKYITGMESNNNIDDFMEVSLPHNPVDLPYNYFDERTFQIVSCYKRFLPLCEVEEGRRVLIRFEGVMAYAKVYINGIFLGEHKGGYTPFEFDVTEYVESKNNSETPCLTVVADATEREDIPPFGGQIDYLTYGGIYREVSLDEYDAVHIKNCRFVCPNPMEASKTLLVDLFTGNIGAKEDTLCSISIDDVVGKSLYRKEFNLEVESGDNKTTLSLDNLKDLDLWSVENPILYTITCTLKNETFTRKFGFRSAQFRADGFYLNNKKLKIRGLNRHQSWPYVGYAMPKRAQQKDADILKYELNLNTVRTSHYPQSEHFLDRCDEIGLLVFEEIPGWQHIGKQEWKDVAVKNVEEMIIRDWNHPSIIIWGVRINESADDNEFYKRTNSLARELDPYRQTGGVRYIPNSNLLEDVYTMNDFSHCGEEIALRDQREVTGLNKDVPYLVTEYNGHMFPTKKIDCEERQNEHVLRHLRVQNASYGNETISGAIGWCAFDYNTHKDFGSGDRICYHGVMDIFRLPKLASWAYSSQVDPEYEIVLKPITYWARGERSIGGVFPLVVCTNCDSISVQFGDYEAIPISQKDETLSHLPYPPFIIDTRHISLEKIGAWGMRWEDVKISGYINGKEVAVCNMAKDPLPMHLFVNLDDNVLNAGEKDVTRIIVSLLDQYRNILPFSDPIVSVSIKGPGRIQGPDTFVLKGGESAFWVESNGEAGEIYLTISSKGFDSKELIIQVK